MNQLKLVARLKAKMNAPHVSYALHARKPSQNHSTACIISIIVELQETYSFDFCFSMDDMS